MHQEHQPGIEALMHPRPAFTPRYPGSGRLTGKVALITGGDSGIGRSVAVLYAREGADVAIIYLADEQPDAERVKKDVETEGRKCLLIPGDVTSSQFCKDAVEKAVAEYGRLDILVNNAAFQERQDDERR